jgi:hypothetical protein
MAASAAAIAQVLQSLRQQTSCLAAGAEVAAGGRVETGLAPLDEQLGGGLPRGRLTELVGRRSSGRMATALGIMARLASAGELVALVDVADGFDPCSAQEAGVALDKLLWVRPSTLVLGLKAGDLVLEAGGFGLLVIYLCGIERELERKVVPAAWARLAQRAEHAKTAVLVVGDRPLVGTFAAATLETEVGRTWWRGATASEGPRILAGRSCRVAVARSKIGTPSGGAPFELVSPAAARHLQRW